MHAICRFFISKVVQRSFLTALCLLIGPAANASPPSSAALHGLPLGQALAFPTGSGKFSLALNLYKDSSGEIIVEYYVKDTPEGRVLFYNFAKGLVDNPKQASLFSSDNKALSAFIADHGWRPLDRGFDTDLGYVVHQWSLDNAPRCQCPYGGYLSLTDPGDRTESVTLFKKLDHSKVLTFEIWCEAGPGRVSLSMKYQLLAASVYDGADGTFFLLFDQLPYIVHLATNLSIAIDRHTDELVTVPSDVIHRYCRALQEGTMPPQQAVNAMEAEIANASRTESSSR